MLDLHDEFWCGQQGICASLLGEACVPYAVPEAVGESQKYLPNLSGVDSDDKQGEGEPDPGKLIGEGRAGVIVEEYVFMMLLTNQVLLDRFL